MTALKVLWLALRLLADVLLGVGRCRHREAHRVRLGGSVRYQCQGCGSHWPVGPVLERMKR